MDNYSPLWKSMFYGLFLLASFSCHVGGLWAFPLNCKFWSFLFINTISKGFLGQAASLTFRIVFIIAWTAVVPQGRCLYWIWDILLSIRSSALCLSASDFALSWSMSCCRELASKLFNGSLYLGSLEANLFFNFVPEPQKLYFFTLWCSHI